MGTIHQLQIRANGAPGTGGQHHFARVELLPELPELWWWHKPKSARWSLEGGWRVAPFVSVIRTRWKGDEVILWDVGRHSSPNHIPRPS